MLLQASCSHMPPPAGSHLRSKNHVITAEIIGHTQYFLNFIQAAMECAAIFILYLFPGACPFAILCLHTA